MRKSFITKKEISKAEKILKRLNEVKFGVRGHLEAMCECAVDYSDREDGGQAFMSRLYGAIDILHTLELIDFEESSLLSRYFINKHRDKLSAKKYGCVA